MRYIAYYRVSTDKQGMSGLGLDAQKEAVNKFIHPDQLFDQYTEIESGKKKNRPVLNQAIEQCRKHDATLIIAKLDRLARNVSFISALMDSGVKFKAVDMPEANELTIHIMSAMAQAEAKAISERTKSALDQLKRKGVKLGTPANLTNESRRLAVISIKRNAETNENTKRAKAYIEALQGQNLTLRKMATKLNEAGFRTSRNNSFTAMQVKRLLPKQSFQPL